MDLSQEEISRALENLLARPDWQQSARMSRFLRFVVERTLAGEGSALKETVVGAGVFDRPPDYDPKVDPVVRVEARRLRLKLQEHYGGPGAQDAVRFLLPKGAYQPVFERAAAQVHVAPPGVDVSNVTPTPTNRWRVPLAIAAIGIAALALVAWSITRRSSRAQSFSAGSTPRLLTAHQGYNRAPSFSPDGRFVVFSRNIETRANLYIAEVTGGEPRQLTDGPVVDIEPVWSPDGLSIAFLREQEGDRFSLVVRTVANHSERIVAQVGYRGAIDWTPDSKSLVAADRDHATSPYALYQVDLADGRKRQITSPPKGTPGDSFPRVSPKGDRVAFVRSVEAAVQDVFVVALQGGDPSRISNDNRVVEGLAWQPSEEEIVASMQRGSDLRSLWRLHLDGSAPERVAAAGVGPVSPSISRDGSALVYVSRFSDTNIWRGELQHGRVVDARPVTASAVLDTGPQVSPDGRLIVWRSTNSGADEVWTALRDGTQARQLTRMNGPTTGSAHWSPDGKWLILDSRPNNNGDLFQIPATGGEPTPLTRATFNEVLPSFSRDGKWVYFSTDRSGAWEVYRMTPDGKNSVCIVGDGAFNAIESPDGKWLYYTRRGRQETGIWRVPTSRGAEEKMTAELGANFWGQWAVSDTAVYFAVFPPSGARRSISRLDLATRKVTDVFSLSKMPVQYDSGMSVAADESAIYWSQLDNAGSNVYIVSGLR